MKSNRKSFFRINSVKTKLVAIMLLVAMIPLAIAIMINYTSSKSKAKLDAEKALITENEFLESEINKIFKNSVIALESVASSSTTINYCMSRSPELKDLVRKHMLSVNESFGDDNVMVLSNRKGKMLLRTDDSALSDISKREYFQTAMQGEVNVSAIIVSNSTHERDICIAVPVKDYTGRVIGTLHRSYNLNAFHDLLEKNANEAMILDNEGTLAVHSQYKITADDEPVSYYESFYMTSSRLMMNL